MKYRVLEYFTDMQDKNREYKAGNVYPRRGYTPANDRILELATDNNIRRHPVIEEMKKERKK